MTTRILRRIAAAALLIPLTLAPAITDAGAQGKKALTHDVYDSWRSISGATLSRDGDWLLYAEVPQEGDAELVVLDLRSQDEIRQPLGWLTASNAFARPQAEFTAAADRVIFLASPGIDEVKAARQNDTKPDQMPKRSLGIIDLSSGEVTVIERVKSFALPKDSSAHLAYLLEKPVEPEEEPEAKSEEGEAATASEPEPESEPTAEPVAEPAAEPEPSAEEANEDEDEAKKKDDGTPLVLRDLASGAETTREMVRDYAFLDDGTRLFYTVSSKEDPEVDGVYAIAPAAAAMGSTAAMEDTVALLTGEGNYRSPAISDDQTRVAFLTDRDDYAADEPVFALYGMEATADAAALWVAQSTEGFPSGMAVSDSEAVRFTDDGGMVLFGIAAAPEPSPEEDEAEDEEEASFDLWHWDDPYPQPYQLEIADEVRDEAFESVWHVDTGRFVQLADEDLVDLSLADNGAVAMGLSDRAWAKQGSYEGFYDDVYVVDPDDGARTKVAERVSFGATLSPHGGYVAWFGGVGQWAGYQSDGSGGWSEGQAWFLHDIGSGQTRNISADLGVVFERQDWDTPNLAPSYGAAGFTDDDSALLIYDQYDVWSVPTAGGDAVRLTEGRGRELETSFRWVRLDPEADGPSASAPLLLSGTSDQTMATSMWLDSVDGSAEPIRLLEAPAALGFVDKADDAPRVLLTRQTFREFPDLWVGSLDAAAGNLTGLRKVSDLGSQTDPYVWGVSELRDFRSLDGLPLKGILIKPDNFDPDRKYPLMVYIYETLHQGLHRFRNPSPGTSVNPSYYASNEYVLWMPDIEYVTPGYPGKDAMKSVLPGINMLVAEGFIDEDAIGIQGHSWGGYQIAYMVTQTDIFAAAEAGAPVSNMTSAYGGIRWASGMVRQFQYERTQSRLGASLWEVPLRYVENSPIFWADEVSTPLLMIHNDADGAVPWYQGIEMIMAMRRLGREAYMFNYNGEAHGLRKRVNQQDWTVRMQEFFDHHLKGAPAPEWMAQGIRGWEKGEVDR